MEFTRPDYICSEFSNHISAALSQITRCGLHRSSLYPAQNFGQKKDWTVGDFLHFLLTSSIKHNSISLFLGFWA
jgi:hypothetical protein